jgi:hypothetical protein
MTFRLIEISKQDYTGPQFFDDPIKLNWIPIVPLSIYSEETRSTRTQFPIRLAYAMTIHKSQGVILNTKAIMVFDPIFIYFYN